ncbi:serine O-acetyltransferase EpsC [Pontibacter silvestris]|uniref:Serine O-acetyltransferase EpsC n=1 Tax=Pontibacter silvestris TaxID=2305183 RepID=A0ABW4WSY3_9BACT|nr:serine O-acetyltransferase EpsC [Pontibacter silvestris]MCC9138117.1 serine acetyltransferase [Pontibacter silvestris]
MQENFADRLYAIHRTSNGGVPKAASYHFCDRLLELLFPQLSNHRFNSAHEVEVHLEVLRLELTRILLGIGLRSEQKALHIASAFMEQLPWIHDQLQQDAQSITDGDPAAQNINEVVSTYPGFWAVTVYRIAHALYMLDVPLLPRLLTEYAHGRTGVEIHPGAQIGSHFCIDHGTGIVIGETAVIGDHVKLYQGVTLGALSVDKSMANTKRHPTIEHDVVIYAGATILGGNTVIGAYSTIGGNVWLTESVPAYSRVYHKAQIRVSRSADPADALNFSI